VARPKLLILDEPCQSLDLEHRKRVARLVDRVCSPHQKHEEEEEDPATACVFVSHHEDELPRSVSHRLVLDKGKVMSRGQFHIPASH
jgi:molybdate transport system ATP-binding protein